MKISEIFYSIQGESTYSGLPCVFVRTSGCNLNCAYCDTKYAQKHGKEMSIQTILNCINRFHHTNLVEITGGEPLLQPAIYQLLTSLNQDKFNILLETNGSMNLQNIPDYVCKIIDVKAPSSGYEDSFLLDNLTYFNHEKDNLKFVLSSQEDYQWMKAFLRLHGLYGQYILVSTVAEQINPQKIAEQILADGLNVRFQLQIHKYIGMN